jgi:hypothetical protein
MHPVPRRDAHRRSATNPADDIPSDRMILAAAVGVGIFICVASAIANAFLLSTGQPFARTLIKCDAAGAVVAILLVWKLLRWSRERNELARQRARIAAELNREIRNAIQLMPLTDYDENKEAATQVKASVTRIERALDEYVPRSLAGRVRKTLRN